MTVDHSPQVKKRQRTGGNKIRKREDVGGEPRGGTGKRKLSPIDNETTVLFLVRSIRKIKVLLRHR